MNNDYSLISILKTLFRWKKHIIIATVLVAIASVIGSLMMDNYYRSSAIVYAASPTLAKPDPIGGIEKNYYTYGTGEDLDRLIAISNSGAIKNFIISKYNLAEYYDVDTSSLKGKAQLIEKFDKHYETTKTKLDALEIAVEDTDPVMARDMTRDARLEIESIAQNIIKESQLKTINALKESIKIKDKEINEKGAILTSLKNKYGIYDSYSQAEAIASQKTKVDSDLAGKRAQLQVMKKLNVKIDSINKVRAIVAGLSQKKMRIDSTVSLFNEGVLQVRLLEVEQNKSVQEISLEKERLKKIESTYGQSFPSIHTIEVESVPFKKVRPRRSIIVLGLTMLAFVMSCLGVLLIESTKDFDWREIYNG